MPFHRAICILILINPFVSGGQTLINGDFEDALTDCIFDISNQQFNDVIPNIKAYGELESLDIINKNCGFGNPQSGSYFVGLEVKSGLTNALGIESTEFLVPGKHYTLEFWEKLAKGDNGQTIRLSIGVSLGARENGDLMYTVNEIHTNWTKHTVNFTTPIRAKYVTVLVESSIDALYLIDNFSLICPDFSLGLDQVTCDSSTNFNLIGPEGFETYTWSNGQVKQSISVNEPNLYWLETEREDCIQRDSILISIDKTICPDTITSTCEFYFPNVFSPNHDGQNDLWTPSFADCILQKYVLIIYDRWGNLVFKETDILKGWNGEFNNKSLPSGLYVFGLEYVTQQSTQIYFKKGAILLLK